jgi:hypothetical protein
MCVAEAALLVSFPIRARKRKGISLTDALVLKMHQLAGQDTVLWTSRQEPSWKDVSGIWEKRLANARSKTSNS